MKECKFYIIFILISVIESYNLDFSHPLIYQAIDKTEEYNSYFGMTVAIRPKGSQMNGSWYVYCYFIG